MARYFAPITKEELKEKVESIDTDFSVMEVVNHVLKDIKVNFNCENSESEGEGLLGLHTFVDTGLTFWGMQAGGDWEYPVFFIVYWDGQKLRGYVPTDGNPYNTDTKEAYGNFDEVEDPEWDKRNPRHTDRKNFEKRYGYDPGDDDVASWLDEDCCNDVLIEQDIRKRILPKINLVKEKK